MNDGDAGTMNDGSKVTWKSYEMTAQFDRSPTVIGSEIVLPDVVTNAAGNDTERLSPGPAHGIVIVAADCELETTEALLLCNPKVSVAESIKAKREFPDANAVTLINRANAVAKKTNPLAL